MYTINPLKRLLTVPNDPLKLLVCKICKKDDVVLNLKTCGCLFCDSCDGDSRYKCISCNSEFDQKIKLSFTKNPRCKYYEHNKCYNSAEYKCRCLPNCFVCSSCLNYIHRKKVRGSCVPEMLTVGITTNDELCQLCKEFYAGFRMTSRPYSKICLDCKTNSNAACTPIEETSVKLLIDWNQFYREYEQSTKNVSGKIKKIEDELESSSLAREQEIEKCKDAISEIQKCLDKYTIQCDVHILLLNKQLDDLKKILNILKPDGKVKTILDLLKDGKLALHKEQGKEQIINLLNFYREKNDNNPRYPVTEQIKTFFIQNDSSSQHILKFPLPSTPISTVSTDSGVSVQEIIDNGVQQLILVEKQSAVNERKIILKNIEKHQDKWERKESFAVNDIVIILDVDATDSHKWKRAKILKLGDDSSEVSFLDFGFQTTVPNSSIGEINGINLNGKSTCFIAQLTGSVNLNYDFDQIDGLPKAQNIH